VHFHRFSVFLLITAALCTAADLRNSFTLYGEVELGAPAGGAYLVELRPLDNRASPSMRAQVNNDGSFEMRYMQAGTYEVHLTTAHGNPVRSDIVHIDEHSNRVTLRIDKNRAAKHNGTVSMRSLQFKAPKAARKEFEKAESANRRGDVQKSIDHLRKAVELCPEYAEAHNNLGVRYLTTGDLAASRTHLERSLELDENSAFAHLNMSALAMSLENAPLAEKHARRALDLGAERSKGEYLLGLALAKQGDRQTAIPHLEEAVKQFPRAHLALADLLARQGDLAGAERQLKEYLDSENPQLRAEVEQWMQSLRAAR